MNGSTLSRFGIGLLLACVAAPAAALADTPTLNPSGALHFSWRGDPARGCQDAGVCDVSGSVEVIPADQSGSSESPRSRDIQIQDDAAVVRVTDPGSTPTEPHICTQVTPIDGFLTVVRRRSGRLLALSEWFPGPSSGDCAGPLPNAFGALTIPARRLPGRREGYDLSSTTTFGSGPFTVTVKSTIRARRPAGGSSEGGPPGGNRASAFPKPHKGLVEQVSIQYRITALSGALTTAFAGRSDPFCSPFDACGASGVVTDAITGASGGLELAAQRVVKRRVSRRAALADFRSGRLRLFDTGVLLKDVLSEHAGWPAGSACTDRLTQLNALNLNATGSRHAGVRLSLATDGTEDPFRTICPGPAAGDVLGSSGALASVSLHLRDLGRQDLRIALPGRGGFVGGSYAGSRSGGVTFGLRLVRVRAGTTVENVFPGE